MTPRDEKIRNKNTKLDINCIERGAVQCVTDVGIRERALGRRCDVVAAVDNEYSQYFE